MIIRATCFKINTYGNYLWITFAKQKFKHPLYEPGKRYDKPKHLHTG